MAARELALGGQAGGGGKASLGLDIGLVQRLLLVALA